MDDKDTIANSQTLLNEFEWFSRILDYRLKDHFGEDTGIESILDIQPPNLEGDPSVYAKVVNHYELTFAERLILVLSLLPDLQPELLDVFFITNEDYGRGFTEFGGIKGKFHGGFIPTGETAIFLLTADDLASRIEVTQVFSPEHFFHRHNIVKLDHDRNNEQFLSGVLKISDEYLTLFTTGETFKPIYSAKFPAKRIDTTLNWDDLVLDYHTRQQIDEINGWIKYGDILLNDWGLGNKIKPGYRSLFHGPPGTGKTLTATLLGKSNNLDVYRVDLSMVISKYIGETEKNLANVFDQAQTKNWILFFDEADSLFGKRTETRNSNDRSANQQVSYLLQRVEDFPGVVILATNLKKNMDEAFTRRFQSTIYFPMPDYQQRLNLWKNNFTGGYFELEDKVDLDAVARKYELAGGSIINILRHCCIRAINRNTKVLLWEEILSGIKYEFNKEGKTL